jgi:hypothetical protein
MISKLGARIVADRFYIRHPNEWYYDLLQVEAWIKNRSLSDEACNLLCARLMQRENYRNEALDHLARKRGITRQQLIDDILKGTAKPMSAEEYRSIEQDNPDEAV